MLAAIFAFTLCWLIPKPSSFGFIIGLVTAVVLFAVFAMLPPVICYGNVRNVVDALQAVPQWFCQQG